MQHPALCNVFVIELQLPAPVSKPPSQLLYKGWCLVQTTPYYLWDKSLKEELYSGHIVEGDKFLALCKQYCRLPRSHIGKLQYFKDWLRPDLMYP